LGTRPALLVIDLQLAMFESDRIPPIHEGGALLRRAQQLIKQARAARIPVFYVRHDGGDGHVLQAGTQGWHIHPAITPAAGEPIIDKRTPDAFHDTPLLSELSAAGIRSLIVTGAQTEVCVDTTCRRARSLGFDVTLVSDGHSTWDSELLAAPQIIRHHNRVLSKHFVQLKSFAELNFGVIAGEG
jgi:nicotinamidase-related amidase